jgi:hypothetical protein
MNHSEAGKGSKLRPTDTQRYAANYDKIFGTKTHRLPVAPTKPDGEQKPANKGEI